MISPTAINQVSFQPRGWRKKHMRYLLLGLLMLGLAGLATASDLPTSNIAPDKTTYTGDNAFDGREGGEDFNGAVEIFTLPYTDTGATCDNADNITLGCAASAAQDVVYKYTATSSGYLTVSLCGSGYDTALGIYNSSQVEIACNDDFCGLQSEISFSATAGQLYYFVVDGFSTNCGSYVINVTPPPPGCDPSCVAGGVAEGEPACGPGYVDNTNGGCNSIPQVFGLICPDEGTDSQVLCGMSGTFDGTSRDTDWFVCYGTGGTMTATCCASFPLQLIFIYGLNCDSPTYDITTANPNVEASLSRTVANGTPVWIWVGASVFDGVPCESPYLLTMTGINTGDGCGPVPTQNTTWGAVKSLFR